LSNQKKTNLTQVSKKASQRSSDFNNLKNKQKSKQGKEKDNCQRQQVRCVYKLCQNIPKHIELPNIGTEIVSQWWDKESPNGLYCYKKTIERNQENVLNRFKIQICVGTLFFSLGEEFQNQLATISICANVHIYLILPRYCKISLVMANDTNERFKYQIDITWNAVMCWVLYIASFSNHYWYEGVGRSSFKSP
jgi:hypothetical protein